MAQVASTRRAKRPAVRLAGGRSLASQDRYFGFMVALPAIALFVTVSIYPLMASLVTSLFEQSLVRPGRTYVGLDNYRQVFPDFVARLATTLIFAAGATVIPVILGVGAAILLAARVRGSSALRGLLMIPWLLPGVVVSFLWAWIFNDSYGVLNLLLSKVGVAPLSVLGSAQGAMAAVIIAKTWQSFPWIMVVALAALQTLPREQLEAAAIEGASRLQRFRYVSWPHLVGPVTLVTVLEFVYNFGNFDTIFVMTGGGPGDATSTLAVDLYNIAFGEFQIGKASAMGVLWLLVLLAFCGGYLVLNRRLEDR